jgi:antirestriction protein ArdC
MPDNDDVRPLGDDAKRDFRKEVTDNLIAMLEQGTAPWQKPWNAETGMAMPFNPTTEKSYRGGNAVHLLATGTLRGYEDPRWMTYKQAQEEGWQVRKGEKGTRIEFWQFRDRERDGDAQGDAPNATAKGGAPLHRIYTVFNGSQLEGIPPYEPKARPEWEVVQSGERIIAGSGVRILHDQPDRAFYSQSQDQVHLPPAGAFPSPAQYYGTALHELIHATGHPSRLNRVTLTKSDGFGSESYAQEELRAELGSLFLAAERGIPHDPEQHAAYVGSWVKALRDDKNEIFRASKDAGRAAEYLLEREQELDNDQEHTVEADEPAGTGHQPDGRTLPEVVARETSEHVAEFDANNGAVTILEKNTATASRDLVEPAVVGQRSDSAALSREQILDNVVDGRPAPNGLPDPAVARAAASLSKANLIVERELGEGARTMSALTDSGRYQGPILGVTDEHVVQGYTSKVGIVHERANLLEEPTVNAQQSVLIEYDRGQAHIQPLVHANDGREHDLGLAMERGR